MSNSSGKILFISGNFFGYPLRIVNKFIQLGYEIDYMEIKGTLIGRIIRRLNKYLYAKIYNNNLLYNLRKFNSEHKIIIFLNCFDLPPVVLNNIKLKYKESYFVLYIWDDIGNLNYNIDLHKYFNKIYSYNKEDSIKYNFIFKPFFYSDVRVNQKNIDISYIGTLHSNRYEVLKIIQANLINIDIKSHLYVNFLTFIYNLNSYISKYNMIYFHPMSYEEYINTLSKSVCTLEILHDNQNNITTRAIEVLGTDTKLITTSKAIKQLDFYRPNNIFIIEDVNNINFKLLEYWMNIPYEKIDKNLLDSYSIDNWIKTLIINE